MMNSVKLEKEWKCYTGKYQNSGYLRTKANPMERAYKRTVTSKLFRGLFIKALDESRSLPHIDRIAGVFRCSISRIPIDDAERNSIQRDFARMINKITSDGKLWQSLSERASESNENKSLVSIARGIKERSVVDGLAQSQLRLPFIHDAVYKNSVHDNKISKRSHQNGRELHRLFGAKLQSKNPKQQQTQFRRKTTQQKGEKANWV
ncbi:uncharacterized protein LODBEIA_P02860 [Lodderomyces beijingensis]|uniref:Uncharacterized protein n=1 Tax=Lodderomyces beijingensis TaxID=1775926 RepID=A0ABP0ZIQ3_9ASCO